MASDGFAGAVDGIQYRRGSGPCFTAERLCWRWAMDDAPMIMASSRSLWSFEWCTSQRRAAEMASISNWAHTGCRLCSVEMYASIQ